MKSFILRNTIFLATFLIFSSLTALGQINGLIYYHQDSLNPLPNVTVKLYSNGNNVVATTVTNNDGEFIFTNIQPGDYTLKASATINIGDLNLIDPALVLQYLNGTYTFNVWEFAAGDVNGNNNVNHGDYNHLLKMVLKPEKTQPFEAGEWQFEEKAISLTARSGGEDIRVWGTSTGDVEGIWMPGGRNIIDLQENIQELTSVGEQEIELEIGSNYTNLISGFNLNLIYPKHMIEILDVTGPDENFLFNLDENTGALNVIWLDENENPGTKFFGETLFRVKVRQNQNYDNIEGEDIFSLLEGGMMLDSKFGQIDNIVIKLPAVSTTPNKLEFEIIGYPNPAADIHYLKITSPTNNYANIYVYDFIGRLVKQTINTTIYKGTQLIHIETENLPSGHYFYKINLAGNENTLGRFYKTN
ncbi:MAG: carboxypeptidase regulatory-like domain-containing protein [Bacteroidetes bacterium]|nr:carboxypeptidase regulatory-like domain-containing protein [Bacteroidota bacterium]MBL6943046.1 carboxypeptidase regulatory-like domain-containing protein [Bacteroidales bacterium]